MTFARRPATDRLPGPTAGRNAMAARRRPAPASELRRPETPGCPRRFASPVSIPNWSHPRSRRMPDTIAPVPLPRHHRRLAPRSRGILGRGRKRHRLGPPARTHLRPHHGALRPVVPRRRAEHLLQRARPPRAGRARRAERADLGQPDDRADRALHLSRAARPHRPRGRRAGRARRAARRPGGHLHADDPGSRHHHAGLRPPGRHPFRGVRRLRRGRAGQAHRGRHPAGDRLGLLRPGAGPGGHLQAAAGCRHRLLGAQAAIHA